MQSIKAIDSQLSRLILGCVRFMRKTRARGCECIPNIIRYIAHP